MPGSLVCCETTASRSDSPKRAMRSRSSPRRPRTDPRRSSPPCVRSSAQRTPIWERFDAIFDAYWRRRGMRSKQVLRGSTTPRKAPLRRLGEAGRSSLHADSLADHVERRNGSEGAAAGERGARREGASRAEALARADLRHIIDPEDVAQTQALAARLARNMRANSCGATRYAGADGGSTSDVPSIGAFRMAVRPSILPGGAARRSHCASSCCSTHQAR